MRNFRKFARGAIDAPSMLNFAANPMEQVFYGHQGRIAYKWHHYLEIYDRHFSRFRGRPVRVLELGILFGGSLQMWRKYFGEASRIHGIDVRPECAHFSEEGIAAHVGSQSDPAFLARVVEEMGGVDIVVDDGSHRGSDQIASFEALYPILDPAGIYVCEDTHTSYWKEFDGGYRRAGTFIEHAKGLVDRLHAWYIQDESADRDESFARMTQGVFFYDSVVVLEKRKKDEPFHCWVGRPSAPDGERT